MQSIILERHLSLVAAARREGVHPATLFRWISPGLLSRSGQRVRLESMRRGGRTVTSKEALQRFYTKLSADTIADADRPQPPTSPSHEAAERRAEEQKW